MLTTSKTILYIEDDPASRSLVERALKHAGYNVLVAERGLDGIDLARKSTPDLILTDINLPDLSGREITTTLRGETRFKRTPIVALTAQGYGQHRAMAMAAGVTGYMTKPVDVELLADKVEYYLQGGKDHIDADTLSEAREEYTQEVVGRLEEKIRDLETSNTTLKYLDKMKDAFIQITAHELRTPLTLVNGYSRLLGELPPQERCHQ
ncbi:MAG: response regulator [Anaerolineae bacterium]